MFDFEMRRSIGRALGTSRKPRPEHKAELEEKLLNEFHKLHPKEEKYAMKKFGMRKALLMAAATMMLGVAACAAPADIEVDVGRRISIELAPGAQPPANPEAIVDIIRGSGSTAQVNFRGMMKNGKSTFEIEAWGHGLSKATIADKIRVAVPELAKAEIHEEVLEAKVHGTLGAKLGHEWLNLDTVDENDIEAAKEQVMKQLAAQGVTGKVDVDVQNAGPGKRTVKVIVESPDCEPGQENPMQPAPAPTPAPQ